MPNLTAALLKYLDQLIEFCVNSVGKLVIVFIILFLSKKIFALIIINYKRLAEKKGLDPLLKSFLSSLIKTVYNVAVFMIIIDIIGVKAVSVATLLGTAGLAIGLALQGSLANLAGGILILFFRPFNQGDFISNNAGIEGSVFKIKILYTELITPDNKSIIVPNSQLSNNAVINFSRNPERRVDLVFSVSYNTPIEKAIGLMEEIASNHPKILQDKEKRIRLFKQSASSLDFAFRVWTKKEDYWDVYFDCNEKIKKVFDLNGVEIPYQKIDIYNNVINPKQ